MSPASPAFHSVESDSVESVKFSFNRYYEDPLNAPSKYATIQIQVGLQILHVWCKCVKSVLPTVI